MKKVHKFSGYNQRWGHFESRCKVHNKTWAWKGSNDWRRVSCERCLEAKKK